MARKPSGCFSKQVPAKSQKRVGFRGSCSWEEYFGSSILSGHAPFLIPCFVDSYINDVFNVRFGVWGVDVVGVGIMGEARGEWGDSHAFFC